MNVLIISSSREEIDDYYKSIAKNISSFLANDNDLVFGASSKSMMGICYKEFAKKERKIYAFTTSKYIEDLKNLDKAKKYIRETTFDLKKDMLFNSDLVVALPGGVGTLSEILSYIEEKRSNELDIPIIIYDENNYYKLLNSFIKQMNQEKFISDISDLYVITHNKEEFENEYYKVKGKVK